jgi:hypothetical protein
MLIVANKPFMLTVVMLTVVMLTVVIMSVVIMSVVMLSVVSPTKCYLPSNIQITTQSDVREWIKKYSFSWKHFARRYLRPPIFYAKKLSNKWRLLVGSRSSYKPSTVWWPLSPLSTLITFFTFICCRNKKRKTNTKTHFSQKSYIHLNFSCFGIQTANQ